MSRTSLGRSGLLLVGLLSLMALFSTSALAAGKPIVTGGQWTNAWITNAEQTAEVNPNGHATTVTFEYRKGETETGEYKTFATKEIGSGTTAVAVSAKLNGLPPQTPYQGRITATNSSGAAAASLGYTEHFWFIRGEKNLKVAEVVANGTFKLEYTNGAPIKVECTEDSGTGTIGHKEAVGDGFQFTGSGCHYYQKGEEKCVPPQPFKVNLNNGYAMENPVMKFRFCPGEQVEWNLSFPEAFTVTRKTGYFKEHPMTLTTTAKFGSIPVTVTITSTWYLVGEQFGKEFGIFEN